MEYFEYKPHVYLNKYVECYWSAYSDKPPFREKESLIPDGTIEFMFNFGNDYVQISDGKETEVKGSHIIGIRKTSLTISQTRKQNFFCIRFKLGGTYPFFKLPVHLFANGFYSMYDLLGNEVKELEEKLFNAKDSFSRVQLADQFLLQKLNIREDEYVFAKKCIPAILSAGNVGSVLRSFNVNYKTLARRFDKVLGLSPSELIKINRFNNAVYAMYSCKYTSLTSITYACGYYDQSHFIREFKQLTNYTPGEFLKEQFTIVQIIQPALAERLSKSYNF
jgi:AraC-like DNA-binding protein